MNQFSFLSTPTALALGHTLLYSLWQAFVVFIVLRLILKYIARSSATFRYAVSSLAYLGIATWFVITFLQQLSLRQSDYIARKITEQQGLQQMASHNYLVDTSGGLSFAFLDNYLPWLVVGYLIGIGWFGLRLMLNYFQTIRLRTEGLSEMEPAFMDYIWDLANKMSIRKPVFSHISSQIDVPVMIGFFRPVILLPLAAINNLSPQQIEAILLHELAHIRRNDYVWNLFQTVLDMVLFFNPFAYWISKNIRNEREQCCDEMVLQFSDPYHYARALLSLEESGKANQNLVMAAVRKQSQLFSRIKNIMEMKNNRTNLKQKFIALAIVITATLSVAWLTPKESKTAERDTKKQNSKAFSSILQVKKAPKPLPANAISLKLRSDSNHPEKVAPLPPLPPVPPVPPPANVAPLPPVPPAPPVTPLPPSVSMNEFKDSVPSLEKYFNSDDWKKQQEEIKKSSDKLQQYFKGPEWKKQMEAINKSTQSIQKYFQSQDWKQQQKQIQKSTAAIQKYFNSDAWKRQQEEIQKDAAGIQKYFDSPEWKKNQEDIQKNAEKIQQYFKSDEWNKQQEELKHAADSIKAYFKSDSWKKQQEDLQDAMAQTKKFLQSDQWKKQQETFKKAMQNLTQTMGNSSDSHGDPKKK